MIKKLSNTATFVIAKVIFLASGVLSPAFAQIIGIPNPSRFDSVEDIINTLGNLIRPVVIIALIAIVMYGGWVRLTSQGNPDKIARSSQIIVSGLIGFAIIALAPVIVEFLGSLLGISGGLLDTSTE